MKILKTNRTNIVQLRRCVCMTKLEQRQRIKFKTKNKEKKVMYCTLVILIPSLHWEIHKSS